MPRLLQQTCSHASWTPQDDWAVHLTCEHCCYNKSSIVNQAVQESLQHNTVQGIMTSQLCVSIKCCRAHTEFTSSSFPFLTIVLQAAKHHTAVL
jgi:hypothetical protein